MTVASLLVFDDNVPREVRLEVIDVASNFPTAISTRSQQIRVRYGDEIFEEQGYPAEWWAYAKGAIEIGFRPTADIRKAAAHELWHIFQYWLGVELIYLTRAQAQGVSTPKENEAHQVQEIYGSTQSWARWSHFTALDGEDDWQFYKDWAEAHDVRLPTWAIEEPEEPDPVAPTPPMTRGNLMELYVPGNRLGAVELALHGDALEVDVIPLYEEEFWFAGDATTPPNTFQREIMRHFPIREWGNISAIMHRESGFNPHARCTDCFDVYWRDGRADWGTVTHGDAVHRELTGGEWRVIKEDSRSLTQINTVPWSQFADWDLEDPDVHMRAARIIFNDGLARGDAYAHWRSADPRVWTPRQVIASPNG